MRSAERLARLLGLIPYLQANPGIGLDKVASEFSMSTKEVRSELSLLFMCGLPGGMPDELIEVDMDAVEGEGVVHLTNAEYLTRPMRFTPAETAGLRVALSMLSGLAASGSRETVDSVIAKLDAIGSGAPPAAIVPSPVDEPVLARVSQAIEQRMRLRLTYHGANRDEVTCPVVDPVGLTSVAGAGYLEAWSLERGAWRTYRLDRIADAQATGAPASDHGRPPPRQGWFADPVAELRLRIAPQAAWIVDYYPCGEVVEVGDELEARFPVADRAWAVGMVLRFGSLVRVIEPVEIATAAASEAKAALAHYR